MDGKNGTFVAMPDWKDSKGTRHEVCFPVTVAMRDALNSAIMGEYQRTVARIAARGERAMQPRPSALETLHQKIPQEGKKTDTPEKRADRGER